MKKKTYALRRSLALSAAAMLWVTLAQAQPTADGEGDVGLGTFEPDPSALFDMTSTSKGFLMPRMTTAERDAIPSPANGLMIFNTDEGEVNVFSDASGTPQWDAVVTTGSNTAWLTAANAGLIDGTDNFFGTLDATPIRVLTNNTQQMIIEAGGNVGIGEAIPIAKLDVEQGGTDYGIHVETTNPANTLAALRAETDGTGFAVVGVSTHTSGNGAAFFRNSNAANTATAVTVDNNGIGGGIKVNLTNASNGARGIDVTQSGVGPGVFATSAGGNAVWGITSSISAAGVIGDNTFGEAVVGRNRGGNGVGAVVGRNDSSGYGVRGFNTKDGVGVIGQAGISGGTGQAGRFENVNAANVNTTVAVASNGIGNGISVQLTNASNGGRGLDVTQSGVGPGVFATSAGGNAVWGITSSISAAGVIGDNTFGEAVVGRNRGGNGVGAVVGRNDSSGYGVRGFNTKDGVGVIGQAGISGGTGQAGRFENVNAANVNTTVAVASNGIGNGISVQLTNASNGGRGIDVTQTGVGPGVFATSAGGNAVWGITSSISAAGVIGDNTFGEAVVGRNRGGNGVGAVVGRNDSSGYGVRGFNTKNGYGVLGQAGISGGTGTAGRFENVNAANTSDALQVVTNSAGNAARFTGNVVINGNLTVSGTVAKGGGTFKIDHPLEPATKYLYHSFVESPEMMNIYNGTITLDASGTAIVEMPKWFEAVNTEFRYQLTPIGAPGPNLHIAEEIEGNRFRIAGGSAGMKVSWQVTGVRNDPFSKMYRTPVEEMKAPEDQGRFLHPEAIGKPVDLQIGRIDVTSSEILRLDNTSEQGASMNPSATPTAQPETLDILKSN